MQIVNMEIETERKLLGKLMITESIDSRAILKQSEKLDMLINLYNRLERFIFENACP
ncbi:MAG TPA: aspartyl-phosphate phosphatase Spo0E family protein [Oscillospiraceae bacterium]|nr:aspartyl-phosphate phosphatase Spo0E family protein [Oscillospiraceae bacterium]